MRAGLLKMAFKFPQGPAAIIRYARWLGLYIDGMSQRQVLRLVCWRVHRNRQPY